MSRDNPSAERAASQLHVWLGNIEDYSDKVSDSALEYRVGALGVAVRINADAMEFDARTLRKAGCEDLAVLALRLSQDLKPNDGADPRTVEAETLLSGTMEAIAYGIAEAGHALVGNSELRVDTVIDGPVGNVSKKLMNQWTHRALVALNEVENAVMCCEDFKSKSLRFAIRDGWAISALLSTVIAAVTDCGLLDVSRIKSRLHEVQTIAVQCQAFLTRIDELGDVDILQSVIPASRAFGKVIEVVDEGQRLLSASLNASADSLLVTLWRLVSKGRLCVADGDAGRMIDSSAQRGMNFPEVSVLSRLTIDTPLRLRSELNQVADTLRQEWAA